MKGSLFYSFKDGKATVIPMTGADPRAKFSIALFADREESRVLIPVP
jgi:hypothetical protein